MAKREIMKASKQERKREMSYLLPSASLICQKVKVSLYRSHFSLPMSVASVQWEKERKEEGRNKGRKPSYSPKRILAAAFLTSSTLFMSAA